MAMDKDHIEQIRRAAAEYNERVFTYPNVIGYGVGQRTADGRKTGEPCLVVFVQRKLPISALRADEILPRSVETRYGALPIDVVEQAMPRLAVDNAAYDPLRGGCQITASANGGSGTLGAVMYDRGDADVVLLTCNHVLTAAGQRTLMPSNTVVSQPTAGTPVGRTKRIIPWFLTPLGDFDAKYQARVDAGIVTLDAGIDAQFRVIGLGKHPYVPLPPFEGLEVNKRGFTSELTAGTVEQIDVAVILTDFNGDRVRIGGPGSGFSVRSPDDQAFLLSGDSGSLVVDADGGAARGMMFGGDMTAGGLSFGCQLSAIMEELELETPCTGSMNAMFMAALRRRRLLSSLREDDMPLVAGATKNLKKFRMRYLQAAAGGSMGKALEDMFQALAPELSEGLALDDDFAGLMDRALGDLLVQPTVFDMLEYKPPEDFGYRLGQAFDRLRELNPEATGFEWVAPAFEGCGGTRLRDLLAGPAPHRGEATKRRRRKAVADAAE
jgi:hypothetical protein